MCYWYPGNLLPLITKLPIINYKRRPKVGSNRVVEVVVHFCLFLEDSQSILRA